MSVNAKMTAIADAIRGKTGGTEKLTLDGMATAIAGMEVGGGSGGASGIYMAKVTPSEEKTTLTIQHDLGTTDILVAVCWAEALGDNTLTEDRVMMRTWLKTDIPVRLSSTSTHKNVDIFSTYSVSYSLIGVPSQPTSDVYLSSVVDENAFRFFSGGAANARFAAGVTYNVIIMAASAFSMS